jgi:hypothetical protein
LAGIALCPRRIKGCLSRIDCAGWAGLKEKDNAHLSREDYFEDFAYFVGAFVERYSVRYGDQLGGVIIWNEPNLSLEWGGRAPDPEAYTELLRLSYAAAHAARPDIVVLGGALAPTTEPSGSSAGMNEIDFLTRMYDAGAADYFDMLAVHTYGFTHSPDSDPDPGTINFRRIELLREIMSAYGDEDNPCPLLTRWNDDPRDQRGSEPASVSLTRSFRC